jgi:hypothetical protein
MESNKAGRLVIQVIQVIFYLGTRDWRRGEDGMGCGCGKEDDFSMMTPFVSSPD